MKISPPIDAVAAELESWALIDGWKTVGGAIAEQYHATGGGNALPQADSVKGLANATQRIKRIFRGCDGPRYAPQAEELKAAALSALPAERRARLVSPGDPVVLAAVAAKEGIEAVNAVHLRATPDVIVRETRQAIEALIAMRNAAVSQFTYPAFT